MPEAGIRFKPHSDILSYEQIESLVKVASGMGITKIRLTGGEPLVRKGIEQLVAKLCCIDGIDEVCMTTNGVLLPEMAQKLKTAGLNRVNLSIDSLNADRYAQITRTGVLKDALAGAEAAIKAGLFPIKINMVTLDDTTKEDIEAMKKFCEDKNLELQKIMQFSLYDRAASTNNFHTERPPRCHDCNRLRLTADGFLKPCLFSEHEIKVNFDDIDGSIRQALALKPKNGSSCDNRSMNQIGG